MISRSNFLLVSMVILALSGLQLSADQRVWFVRPVEVTGDVIVNSSNSVLAMRSDGTWPVTAYCGTDTGTMAMGATGWQEGPDINGNIGEGLSAAASASGRIGFAMASGGVWMLDRNGWSSTSFGYSMGDNAERASLAFNSMDMPCVAHNGDGGYLAVATYSGYGWYQDKVKNDEYSSVASTVCALDYDSYGQAHVAGADASNLWFAQKGITTGNQWNIVEITGAVSNVADIDLAVDGSDMTWIGLLDNNVLKIANYNPISMSWSVSSLESVTNCNQITMTEDRDGGVGLAYVSDSKLRYRHNDGSGTWTDETVIDFETSNYVNCNGNVGLAYDAGNNPVISYRDADLNGLALAYDPVLVPEPVTLSLLLAGAWYLQRKRG